MLCSPVETGLESGPDPSPSLPSALLRSDGVGKRVSGQLVAEPLIQACAAPCGLY